MKKYVLIGIVSLVILWTANRTAAQNAWQMQDRWNIEFRGAAAFPTQEIVDGTDLDTGVGFEGTIAYRFMPHLAVYTGWGWNHFSAGQSFVGSDIDFEETGYTFGLQFIHPLGMSNIHYMIRGGGIYNHLEAEDNDGDNVGDSDHEFGWQVEAGLSIPLGERWHIMPGVRYHSLSNDFDVDGSETSVDLNYVSAGVGVAWTF